MSTKNGFDSKIIKCISIEEWHEHAVGDAGFSVVLKLDGESMRPLIRKQKDSVTVIPVYRELKIGDIVLFVRKDGAYVVHRICKINAGFVVTIGDNCVGYDAPVPVSDIRGIIIKAERDGKTINLDSAFSRFFGILRMYTRPFRMLLLKARRLGAQFIKGLGGEK